MTDVLDELPDRRHRSEEYEQAHRLMLENRGKWVALVSFPVPVDRGEIARWYSAGHKPSRGWEVAQRTSDGAVTVWGRIK